MAGNYNYTLIVMIQGKYVSLKTACSKLRLDITRVRNLSNHKGLTIQAAFELVYRQSRMTLPQPPPMPLSSGEKCITKLPLSPYKKWNLGDFLAARGSDASPQVLDAGEKSPDARIAGDDDHSGRGKRARGDASGD